MSNIDELMTQLNDVSKFNPMNESFNPSIIFSTFNNLATALKSTLNLNNYGLTNAQMNTVKKIRLMTIDNSYKVVTYPNIHYDTKYKINAFEMFNYVIKKINEHANSNSISFDSMSVIQEAISYTLKKLIGKTPKEKITIEEFKKEYQLHAFGSFTKVMVIPKILPLTILAQKTPMIISYIDNNLLYYQVKNMNNYAKRVEKEFTQLIASNPDMKDQLISYLHCIEKSIHTVMNMYKIIRNTFIQLENEYFYIFNDIIKNNSHLNESCLYSKSCEWLNNTLSMYHDISLNESIDDETLNIVRGNYNLSFKNRSLNMIDDLDKIKNDLGLVSKIKPDDQIYVSNLYMGLYEYPCIDIEDILNKDYSTSDAQILRDNLRSSILGKSINTIITSDNIDKMTVNVLKLIDLSESLIEQYKKYDHLSDDDNLQKKNLINISILDSIYYSIQELLTKYIDILKSI